MLMKKTLKYLASLTGAVLLASTNLAADSVSTDPVGYVTLTIKGTGGASSEAFTYMGVPVHKPADISAVITGTSEYTVTSSSAAWDIDAYIGSYVLITSGAYEGMTSSIVSNTATDLTTEHDLTSILEGGESFSIHAHTTIADVFGATNEAGLGSGSSAGAADTVLLQSTTGFDTYYYKDSGFIGGTGWRSAVDASTPQGETIIPLGAGLIVVRKQSDDLSLVLTGSVFGGDAVTEVKSGYNWKSASIPVALTLDGMLGAANEAGLVGGSSAGAADNIIVPTADGLATYYYKDSGFIGGTGWRLATDASTPQGSTVIAEPGQMFLINNVSDSAFNLVEVSPL